MVFGCLTSLYSQEFELQGEFSGKNLEKSFINVINTSTYQATISQLNGKFNIPVHVGDSILISSIQYKDVKFVVKPEYKTELVNIPLQLKVTELEKVDIYSIGLSGNLEKDAKSIKLDPAFELNMSPIDLANAYDDEFTAQSEFNLRNIALEKNQPNLPTNFDFLAIAAGIASMLIPKKNKKANKNTFVKTQNISNYSKLEDIDFFNDYLSINEENVDAFMTYAYNNGLNEFLKTNPSEMDLIQYLVELSLKYNR
jgi:hypothetical protein